MQLYFRHEIARTQSRSSMSLANPRLSLHPGERDYARHYYKPFRAPVPRAEPCCSPPTPVADLEQYRNVADQHARSLLAIVNGLGSNSLQMGPFANALNTYGAFLNSLPAQFCIGSSNQSEFDAMVASINNASAIANRGIGVFEINFERFCNGAFPLLNTIVQRSQAVNASSRDFTPVLDAVDVYQRYIDQYSIEVWNLSARIEGLANSLEQALQNADGALTAALYQIETNVEYEAQQFAQQAKEADNAFAHWDTEDGAEGHSRYMSVVQLVANTMIPAFNAFVQRVPSTQRVENAVASAEQAVDYIGNNINSFPTFQALPPSSASFPYNSYWVKDRRFGNPPIIGVLRAACNTHHNDTGHTLYIGDMSYEHGGKAKPHSSHRNGNDADVDPVEVGNIPSHDPGLALAAAQRFLAAGAVLIFYADQNVVNDANNWAQQQGIAGRLQFEAAHTNHFHLRV